MPSYIQTTLPEFQEVLRADKGWEQAGNNHEYIFQYPMKNFPGTVVKVFTSINKHNDKGRRRGGDAIHVAAVHLPTGRGIVKSARIHRVPGWQDRLRARIIETIKLAETREWMVK